MMKKRIAIFASGSGTNAEEIFKKFRDHAQIEVAILLSNKKKAYALTRAQNYGIKSRVFDRTEFRETANIVELCREEKIDLIVLAGFMWLVPSNLVNAFPDKIVNIHPALLPKYGGKGMYGMNVHQAVKDNKEKETGITIHYVNERYDEGNIIFQVECPVLETDSPEQIANKVHELEYRHYPSVIEQILSK